MKKENKNANKSGSVLFEESKEVINRYSAKEEIANTYSHAIGIVLGLIGGVFLIQKAIISGIV